MFRDTEVTIPRFTAQEEFAVYLDDQSKGQASKPAMRVR